jgi:hypothetical protein
MSVLPKDPSFTAESLRKNGKTAAGTLKAKDQKSEARRQMTEDRGQKTEDRGQRTEDRSQRTEVRRRRTEDRSQAWDIIKFAFLFFDK